MRRSSFALVATLLASGTAHAAPKIVKGPWITDVTPTSAVIRVEVDPPAPVAIDVGLGLAADGGRHIVEGHDATALQAVAVDGLTPGTLYKYSVSDAKFGSFSTPPNNNDETSTFRFLVYGDNRTDDAAHAAVVRAMETHAADFLVHTGDLVSNGAKAANWQTFFEIESPLLSTKPFFSCVGNHELMDGSGVNYAKFFGPMPVVKKPEQLARTVRWQNARFFFLNGMVSYANSPERQWLDKTLTESKTEAGLVWRIVVIHHGPWSSGPHGGNPRLHEAGIPALLKAHHVDLVLSGHDHLYERGVGDGVPFIVTGGGGAPLYAIKAPIAESRFAQSVHHFVEMTASATALQAVVIRKDGSTLERCSITKSVAGWTCDAPAVTAGLDASAAGNGSDTDRTGGPSPRARSCACDAVGTSSEDTPFSLGALGAILAACARVLTRASRSSSSRAARRTTTNSDAPNAPSR